jgi:hypothetical protein
MGVGGEDRWELWTNLMPYHGMSNVTVLAQVLSGGEVRPQVPGENGAAAIEPPSPHWEGLMRRCWSQVCTSTQRGLLCRPLTNSQRAASREVSLGVSKRRRQKVRKAQQLTRVSSQTPAARPCFTEVAAQLEAMKVELKRKLKGDKGAASQRPSLEDK